MEERINLLCTTNNITAENEILLIKKAILEENDSIVLEEEIFTKKKWEKFKEILKNPEKTPKITLNYQIRIVNYPIYTRFPIQSKTPTSQVIKCIVMGPCGNGKTCLINHLCGCNLQTGHTKSSLTRDITELKSQFQYDRNFVIYDTPGTTSSEDKLMHAVHLKELLTFKPINSILILVKYEPRYDDIMRNIYKQVKMLKGYEENIIFAVSHFDLAKQPNFVVQELDKMFRQIKIHNQIIFYSNNGVNQRELSDKVFEISKSMFQRKIQIDENTFLKFFNLQKQETQEMYFKADEIRIIEEMKYITDIYIENAMILPKNNERDAIFQDLQVALRIQLNDLFGEFVKHFQNTMSTLEYYSSYYTLQLKINEYLSQYEQKIRSLQNFSFIQSTSTEKCDIRDLIKKCPNADCGLIWFRVEECPNAYCGTRPTCMYDFLSSKYFRYKITRDKKSRKLKIQKIKEMINKKKINLQRQNEMKRIINNIQNVFTLSQGTVMQKMNDIVKSIEKEIEKEIWKGEMMEIIERQMMDDKINMSAIMEMIDMERKKRISKIVEMEKKKYIYTIRIITKEIEKEKANIEMKKKEMEESRERNWEVVKKKIQYSLKKIRELIMKEQKSEMTMDIRIEIANIMKKVWEIDWNAKIYYWKIGEIGATLEIEIERKTRKQMFEMKKEFNMIIREFLEINVINRIQKQSLFPAFVTKQQKQEKKVRILKEIQNYFATESKAMATIKDEIKSLFEQRKQQIKKSSENNQKANFDREEQKMNDLLKELQIMLQKQLKWRRAIIDEIKVNYEKQQLIKVTPNLIGKNLNGNQRDSKDNSERIIQFLSQQFNAAVQNQENLKTQNNIKQQSVNANQIGKQPQSSKVLNASVGCNQAMNFNTLPRLENIEEILIEWYKVNTFEQVLQKVNEDQKLRETKIKMQNQIRQKLEKVVIY